MESVWVGSRWWGGHVISKQGWMGILAPGPGVSCSQIVHPGARSMAIAGEKGHRSVLETAGGAPLTGGKKRWEKPASEGKKEPLGNQPDVTKVLCNQEIHGMGIRSVYTHVCWKWVGKVLYFVANRANMMPAGVVYTRTVCCAISLSPLPVMGRMEDRIVGRWWLSGRLTTRAPDVRYGEPVPGMCGQRPRRHGRMTQGQVRPDVRSRTRCLCMYTSVNRSVYYVHYILPLMQLQVGPVEANGE